ncbi:MAG TPA: HAD family phosphatase [Terriglobales bacterium]|jgi:putative hydrolase of the HAD superfamily
MKEQKIAEGKIKIKGVVFDYGRVLSVEQVSSAVDEMAAICGVPMKSFLKGYWDYRLAYDRGDLDVNEYWTNRMRTVGVNLNAEQIAKIVIVDSKSWSQLNPISVEWVKQLQAAGLQLAVLSNMPLDLKNYLIAHLDVFSYFQHLIFSCDVHLVKPEPEIYQHCLNALQLPADEVLFLDDKQENIEAAVHAGIHCLLVDSIENTIARVREQFDLPVPAALELSTGVAK